MQDAAPPSPTSTSPGSPRYTLPAHPPLKAMPPAYFALVMATGIVSIACDITGYPRLAHALLWVNVPAYVILWGLLLLRLVRYPRAVCSDLCDHGRGVGFFTLVAATCVLGSQFVVLRGDITIGWVLWVGGLALWATLTYLIFTLLTVRRDKPTLNVGLNGGWLVAVVAPQSVSILGSQLAPELDALRQPMLFLSLVLWLGGGMLYTWIISLIFYRYTFLAMTPGDLAPPYWINMGAVAISTLAGALLVVNAGHSPLLEDLLPFIKGVTLLFWATATWWVPMLLTLGLWRHVYCRFPLRYDPSYWGAVFPLGMYTVCTYRLAGAIEQPFLLAIPRVSVFIALAAWALTAVGLVYTLIRVGLHRQAV